MISLFVFYLENKYMKLSGLIFLLILTVQPDFVFSQIMDSRPVTDQYRRGHYKLGDFISYSEHRYTTSIAVGRRFNYFGTTGGLLRYHRFRNEWHRPVTVSDGLADNYIALVAFDKTRDQIWALTGKSLSYFNDSFFWWENIPFIEIGISEADDVYSLGIGNQNIWLHTKHGYIKCDKNSRMFFNVSNNSELKNDGKIFWFGELGKQNPGPDMYHFQGSYSYFPNQKLQDMNLRSFPVNMYRNDNWNNLWFTTWGAGPGKINLISKMGDVFRYGLCQSAVDAICRDGDYLWFGGMAGGEGIPGITRWDTKNNVWTYFEAKYNSNLLSDEVTVIKADSKYVWVGTTEGLSRYDKNENSWKTYTIFNNLKGNVIYDIDIDKDGVWAGTDRGISTISYINGRVNSFNDKRISIRDIYAVLCDDEYVWAGTQFGIFRYDRQTAQWDSVEWSTDIVRPATTAIAKWENEIWFATGGSIQMLNKQTGEWTAYQGEHYFEDGNFYRMAVNDKVLWATSMSGLVKLNRESNKWTLFTDADGLIDMQVNPVLMENDLLWIGTPAGVTRFLWNTPGRSE